MSAYLFSKNIDLFSKVILLYFLGNHSSITVYDEANSVNIDDCNSDDIDEDNHSVDGLKESSSGTNECTSEYSYGFTLKKL